MSQLPFYLLAFAGVLGVLILVHELGHYLAARLCNVKVLRFSIGFGRPLLARRYGRDGTEWVLAAFPLGGYVKMLDEREAPVTTSEQARAFNRQTVGRRSLIVAAGPLANFLMAILLYWGVFMMGSRELQPILGEPPPDTPAAIAGIRDGERVISVDGEEVASYGDLRWLLLSHAAGAERVTLEVLNGQRERRTRELALSVIAEHGWEGDPMQRLGITLHRPAIPPVVGKISPQGAGDRAGLLVGDRIEAIEESPVDAWHELVVRVRESPGRALTLSVRRGDQELLLTATPDAVEEQGRVVGKLGVAVAEPPGGMPDMRALVRYDFFEAGRRAVLETWDKSWFTLQMMGRMFIGEVSWRNLSGPVTIADYAGQSARLGLDYYLKFMALVSISLGVLNLLPLPVLDGGHLLYHMIEVIRRRPLSERAMEAAQRVGMGFLIVMMAFAFFNDLTRLFSG